MENKTSKKVRHEVFFYDDVVCEMWARDLKKEGLEAEWKMYKDGYLLIWYE